MPSPDTDRRAACYREPSEQGRGEAAERGAAEPRMVDAWNRSPAGLVRKGMGQGDVPGPRQARKDCFVVPLLRQHCVEF